MFLILPQISVKLKILPIFAADVSRKIFSVDISCIIDVSGFMLLFNRSWRGDLSFVKFNVCLLEFESHVNFHARKTSKMKMLCLTV